MARKPKLSTYRITFDVEFKHSAKDPRDNTDAVKAEIVDMLQLYELPYVRLSVKKKEA